MQIEIYSNKEKQIIVTLGLCTVSVAMVVWLAFV